MSELLGFVRVRRVDGLLLLHDADAVDGRFGRRADRQIVSIVVRIWLRSPFVGRRGPGHRLTGRTAEDRDAFRTRAPTKLLLPQVVRRRTMTRPRTFGPHRQSPVGLHDRLGGQFEDGYRVPANVLLQQMVGEIWWRGVG